jgi:hypothetical protein
VRGDEVTYRWSLTGTNTGPEGTGHRVCISGFEKGQLGRDGLIASSQGNFDALEYRRQLQKGMSPECRSTAATIEGMREQVIQVVERTLTRCGATTLPLFLFIVMRSASSQQIRIAALLRFSRASASLPES